MNSERYVFVSKDQIIAIGGRDPLSVEVFSLSANRWISLQSCPGIILHKSIFHH